MVDVSTATTSLIRPCYLHLAASCIADFRVHPKHQTDLPYSTILLEFLSMPVCQVESWYICRMFSFIKYFHLLSAFKLGEISLADPDFVVPHLPLTIECFMLHHVMVTGFLCNWQSHCPISNMMIACYHGRWQLFQCI